MRPQAEQTPVRFVDPDEKSGKTEQGYLRVMGAPGGDVVFDWKLSRKHDHLAGLVGPGYVGVLQSDGYGTYAAYAKKSNGAVLRVGCRAHARRKFFEARDENREKADAFLAQIGAMYAVESDCDGAKDRNGEPTKPVATAAGRATRRAEVFPAILEELKTRAKATPAQVRPRSRLGEACAYLLNQWEGLAAHATIGDSRLDNNLVDGALARRWRSPQGKQNAIRPSAVGKKNWLFIGRPDAGQRTAIIYSIVVSCQRHGVDPHEYLRDVLTKLPGMTTRDDIDALLPSKWKAA